jgi:hypothetical protein
VVLNTPDGEAVQASVGNRQAELAMTSRAREQGQTSNRVSQTPHKGLACMPITRFSEQLGQDLRVEGLH